MRPIFNRAGKGKREDGFFSKKTYQLRKVQEEFAKSIRNMVMEINNGLDQALNRIGKNLDDEISEFIYSELTSNLLELELNINTIIVNFSRITGVGIRLEEGLIEERTNILRRGQVFFLLDGDTSEVYGQKLIYLQEELKSELIALSIDIKELIIRLEDREVGLDRAGEINRDYFRINSDLNTIIDETNQAIDNIYDNISANRDTKINLSFLLISAFLSVILFFPEFNNMLNLKEEEVTYEDKLDEIIYEKVMDDVDIEDLLDIKANRTNEDILEEIENEELKKIIEDNIAYENKKLETEKNRIKIFITILLIILLPFLLWIVFIVI